MRPVTAVAHRGDPYRVLENTLPSLRSALDRGADAVEMDVRLTRDGVPVLLHDSTLTRLWGHDRPLASLNAAEVDEATGGRVPTLASALKVTDGSRVMIDIPGATSESVRTIVGVIHDSGAAERAYYCAGPSAMLAVRGADRAAEIALTWTTAAPPRASLLEAVRPRWLNYRFGLIDSELTAQVHRHGMLVSAWTPDTKRSMRRLLEHGVDSITTNRIDVLCSLREQQPR
ncbi:glycerophosphodiester phosphodiesterase [Streptomyces tsukubensis]|uniref:Glycerophosphodiester phosphodiesterase n=1 Tax=Streptomyces tsukubensis TaxID=83656 RepID=A0A1V4A5E3_9ACTN|nr:glycerophosphodiester phosphodiesterase [Streptomyces tsukubensis]OON76423.1 glycerophosphodiester phosphodiesterase [Streptomyces tsukubensis]QFR96003.1 glycerophosphodiester phosphodiesterase [Streptomyces tsukubensis]